MSQPVGVLALRIWRGERGEIRARVSTKLDVVDATPAEFSHHASVEEIDAAVAEWVRRYAALTRPFESHHN
jgi:hypothetical protein